MYIVDGRSGENWHNDRSQSSARSGEKNDFSIQPHLPLSFPLFRLFPE